SRLDNYERRYFPSARYIISVYPQFSPDSKYIAFVVQPVVYVMHTDGSGLQEGLSYEASYMIKDIQWLSNDTLLINEQNENDIRSLSTMNTQTGQQELFDFPFEVTNPD